jgi:GT2 family glycosyltransferase
MKIGCAIVSYNNRSDIRQCIASVQAQNISCEIVVVDNASHDETKSIVSSFESVHLISNSYNRGFAKATNTGTRYLLQQNCTHILWLNPDAVLENGALEKLVAGMERHNCAITQPTILCADRQTVNTIGNEMMYLGMAYCKDFGSKNLPTADAEIFFPSGACMLINADLFTSIGMLDETFFLYNEDTDFAWRALKTGQRCYLVADAKCYHRYSLKLTGKKMYWLESNRLTMLAKNYSLATLILLLPMGILFELSITVHSILNGYLHWKLLAYLRFLKQFPNIISGRQKGSRLQKTDRELVRLFSPEIEFNQLLSPAVRGVLNPLLRSYYHLVVGLL